MIEFKSLEINQKPYYETFLRTGEERGCEYNFVNLFLWGRQKATIVEDNLVCFSQFNRKSVYLFPVGLGDKKATLDAIIHDADRRGIPCRLVGLTSDDCALLERLYPGKFRYHFDRDSFDYVYDIHDLADLKGRKFQKKRNHLNRFRQENPIHTLEEINDENLSEVIALVNRWYEIRQQENPHGDYHMERAALKKAVENRKELGIEGLLLRTNEGVVGMTMGSFLSDTIFDVQFEKALDAVDGAYPAINNGFANYLREKYPKLCYLNREDDLGIEGLRKAKISYNPHHMVEKNWACLLEDCYEY